MSTTDFRVNRGPAQVGVVESSFPIRSTAVRTTWTQGASASPRRSGV